MKKMQVAFFPSPMYTLLKVLDVLTSSCLDDFKNIWSLTNIPTDIYKGLAVRQRGRGKSQKNVNPVGSIGFLLATMPGARTIA